MKSVIVVALAFVACASAAPAVAAPAAAAPAEVASKNVVAEPVKIVKSDFNQEANGAYVFAFETDDGTSKQEQGEVKTLNNEKNEPVDVVVVRGSYAFTDPEGVKHTVTYFADETGFHSEIEPKL